MYPKLLERGENTLHEEKGGSRSMHHMSKEMRYFLSKAGSGKKNHPRKRDNF